MGRQGDFVVKYDVRVQELERNLGRVIKLMRQHTNELNQTQLVGPQLSKAQLDQTKVLADRQRGLNDAEKLLARTQGRRTGIIRRLIGGNKELIGVYNGITLALRRMALFWSSAALVFGAQRLIKSIIELAGEYQLVVRQLTILGNEGEQVYSRLASAAFEAAAATGRTFTEAADAMQAWVRQGFDAVQVADLTRTTLIGLNLTELSSIQLVRTLTAQMKAFNIPATDSISIIDKLLGVSRRYAIETSQLATGLRRFASSAAIANVTLDQQIGVMTAMMVRTQQSAQIVGRAGRTIFTRMRRNAIEALETIAKVQVFTDSARQSFRSLWDILGDTAANWRTLTEAEREELAFQAAGLRQREFFLALMADFRIAQEANIESLGSVGLAYKANALLVNTLSKSIIGLRTAWTAILSQQSGILEFVSSLVLGLKALLSVSVQIPAALLRIAAALPALVVVGVSLFTAFSPTLFAVLIAVASAITTLTLALGQLSGPDAGVVLQDAKELSTVMIQEAANTRTLAGEFIQLHDAQNAATDNTDLLIKARDAIERLYPGLLRGEEDLSTVYDILQGSLVGITKRTIELTEARKELLRLEAEQQEFEALGTILESRLNAPKGFTGTLLADPEDTKASLLEIRQHLGDAQAEFKQLATSNIQQLTFARQLLLIIGKTVTNRSDAEKALLITYKDQVKQLEQLRAFGKAGRVFDPLDDEDVIKKLNVTERKRIATLQLTVRWLLEMEKAYTRLRQAQDKQAALDVTRQPEFDEAVKKRTSEFDPDPKVRQAIQTQLQNLAERVKFQERLNTLNVVGLDSASERVRIERLINDEQLKSIQTQIAGTKNATLIGHLQEELVKRQAGSTLDLRLQVRELDDIVRLREKLASSESRRARDRERDDLKNQRLQEQLQNIQIKFSEAQVATHRAASAEAIANTLGQVAAFTFLRDEAQLAFDLAKQAALDLGEAAAPKSVIQATETLLETFVTLQKANDDLDAAVESRSQREIALSDKLLSLKQQESVRLVALQQGPLAAAQATIRFAEENLAVAQSLTNESRRQAEVDERLVALAQARSDLVLLSAKQQEAIRTQEAELAETTLDIELNRLGIVRGELAVLTAIRDHRKALLLDALAEGDSAAATLQQGEARLALTKAQGDLDAFNDQAKADFDTKINQLLAERLGIEEANLVAETTLREGKLAGLNKELELLDDAEVRALAIVDTKKQELALQEILNARKEVEGDITRTNIDIGQRALQQFIQLAGQQITGILQGDFNVGTLVTGLSGVLATTIEAANPLISGLVLAAGSVLGSLFEGPADELGGSIDRNTTAIDRNTQTLQDVFAQQIGVPTGFTLPASIGLQGRLPGGGGTTVITNNITIPIDGRGQDVDQIAIAVQSKLDKQFSINSRRGFGTNVLSLG